VIAARRIVPVTLGVASVLLLAACSQAAALAPVGGNHFSEVRFAAIDVLTAKDVKVLTAPVCVARSAGAITCSGTTTDDHAIRVISTAADPSSMTVTVAGATIYSGSVQKALDTAVRGRP
jgi:hypothetical protein